MSLLKTAERASTFRANILWPNVEGISCSGLTATVRNIGSGSVLWAGYNLNNNDAATRYLQVFFRPASEVVLGVTPADDVITVGASGVVVYRFNKDEFVTQGRALSVAATTTEFGATGPTAAMTGSIYYLP